VSLSPDYLVDEQSKRYRIPRPIPVARSGHLRERGPFDPFTQRFSPNLSGTTLYGMKIKNGLCYMHSTGTRIEETCIEPAPRALNNVA
jgi:hypothetical protein